MNNASPLVICSPGTFRLLLALVVVVDHFTGLMMGRAAVFLFFVLSGFWIHRIWLDRYQLTCSPYATFIISRMWRLVPTMLVASALAMAVQVCLYGNPVKSLWSDGIVHSIGSHLFLIGYSNLSESRLVVPAWSLDIEMQFYLVAPLLATILKRFHAVAFVAVCAILMLFDVTPAAFHALGWFAVGMIASAYGRPPSRFVAWGSLLAMPALLFCVAMIDSSLLIDGLLNDQNRQLNIALAILGIPIALHTCFCVESQNGRERGNLSYIIYLVHWPLLLCAQWAQQLHLLAAIVPAVAILPMSLAILRWIDAPAQSARARWVAGRMERQNMRASTTPVLATGVPREIR